MTIIFISCGKNPDTIYINGKIYSLDGKNSIYEAVAVKDGKIISLGSNSEIKEKYSTPNTIDLGGKVVLPGFIDTEGAVIEFSKNLNIINLVNVKTIEEIKRLVAEKVKTAKEGEWIGGFGWSELSLPESELDKMYRTVLDEVAPNQNVYLLNLTSDALWVNTKLLNTLNITKETKTFKEGEIELDEDNVPTGILYDSAINIVKNNVPEFSREQIISSLNNGLNELLKYGITEVQDRTVTTESITIFKELIDNGKFPIRLYAILSGNDKAFDEYLNKGIEVNYKDKLTVRAVSLDYDGAFDLQDAAMKDDFLSDPKRKVPYSDEYDIENVFKKSLEKNFQFRIKTVGDRAVNSSLNAIEKILKEKSIPDHRTVIEHVEFIENSDIERLKNLKILPSVRPDICMSDMELVPKIINIENKKDFALWNTLMKANGMISSGSDFPFHQINPFIQIYYLVTRQIPDISPDTSNIEVINPDQKISLLDALKSYTIWAAYTSFEDEIKGTLEEGKFADMIVLSEDIFNSDVKKLLETKVIKTIINGKVVYESK